MSEPVNKHLESDQLGQSEINQGADPNRPLTMKERYFQEILRIGGKLPPNAQPRVRPRQAPFGSTPVPGPAVPPAVPSAPLMREPVPPPPASVPVASKLAAPAVPPRQPAEKRSGNVVPRARPTGSFTGGNRFLKTQRLSQVDMSAPVWVVRCPKGDGLLPAGLSVLVGDPGAGKSTLIRALVANLSTGKGPFGAMEPAGTLFLTWEDDESSGILPHLVACGGNPGMVHMLRGVGDLNGDENPWVPTPGNLELVRAYLEAHSEVRLVVVDVLSSLLALGGVDSSGSEEVRRLLDPLHRMGQEMGVAVLLLHHQNKRVGERALVRVAGSIQVTGTARLVWLLAADPSDPGLRQLALVKCNLPGKSRGFAFRETPVERAEVAGLAAKIGKPLPAHLPDNLFRRLEIVESESVSAEDLLKGQVDPRHCNGFMADDWVLATLAGNRGEMPVSEMARLARDEGVGDKALAAAKTRLKAEGKIRYQKRDGAWWILNPDRDLIALGEKGFPSASTGVDL
ncbi:MAG: AAA family ATPase [Gemmataceae bacterium]